VRDLSIHELMEEQRARVCSRDLAERFAAALLIPGVLRERFRELNDFELGEVLEREVCSNLSPLAPELTVCMEAADRLCRPSRAGKFIARTRLRTTLDNEGEHLLHAEAALYRARIPHLLLPFQRDKFASNTFMVPSMAEARDCLCQAGFREIPRSPTVLIDTQTRQLIQLYEDKANVFESLRRN
jgi:hypothetical protein